MAIKSPARLWLGGWYHNYDFTGDVDEVRLSRVARSPEWVRLEYENQKPLHSLVGPVVRPGDAFSVSAAKLDLLEGQRATVTAEAGGARKVSWIETRDGVEKVVAVDRFAYTFDAGRVAGDATATLQFRAVGAEGVISVASNLLPREVGRLVDLALANDFAKATAAHRRLYPVFKSLFLEPNPVPVKFAMQQAGLIGSAEVRGPLSPITKPTKTALLAALATFEAAAKK
jgi:hypothetical protein